jgi:hypothetical protein
MKGIAFSAADRDVFEKAAEKRGDISRDRLQKRLADDLWCSAEPSRSSLAESLCRATGRPHLLKAGGLELSELLSNLPPRPRKLLSAKLPRAGCHRPSRSARRAAKGVLTSLQMALWPAGAREGEWLLRAGAHRLARAAADLEETEADMLAARLPEECRDCFKAAWMRLSKIESAGKQAACIRDQLIEED